MRTVLIWLLRVLAIAALAGGLYVAVVTTQGRLAESPARNGGDPAAMAPDPGSAPDDDATLAWRDVAAADVIEAYAWFLDRFADSRFADLARARFDALGGSGALASRETAAPAARDPDIERGAGVPDPEAALRAQFAPADIAFNRPDTMRYREPEKVELVLSPHSAGVAPATRLSDDLSGAIRTVEGVDYALRMQATLSGPDFEVEPSGAQARTVLADRPTRWVWTVRPKVHGPGKVLTLRVDAVLSREGRDLPPVEIETFAERIVVEVGFFDRAVEIAEKVKVLHAAVAGIGTTIVGVLLWLWRNRRTPAPGGGKGGTAAGTGAGGGPSAG